MRLFQKYLLLAVALLAAPLLLLFVPLMLLTRLGCPRNGAKIGLVVSHRWPAGLLYCVMPYELALWRAGAKVRLISPKNNDIASVLNDIDGLVFTGGEDVHPNLFGGKLIPGLWLNEERDKFELELLSEAEKRQLPVLGICRGAELLTIYSGGQVASHKHKLHLLRKHAGPPLHIPSHHIEIVPNSKLAAILGTDSLTINSLHSHNITDPGTLTVVASCSDGLVEAVEAPGKRFILGVQWHPELCVLTDWRSRRVFKALVQATQKGIE